MTRTKATRFAPKVVAPLAMAAIAIAVVAPPTASALPGNGLTATNHGFVAAMRTDDDTWDGGEPAGGTGVDAGPQTVPDVAGIPDQTGVPDIANVGEPAGGTGLDAGPAAPPDTPSGPGLEDGGEPAGGIG